jgi:thiol-disulfide isomerase/thioredoxin
VYLLTAAVVVVGALCVFDLVLTLGVVRRLREHNDMLSRLAGGGPSGDATVPVGQPVGPFSAVATSGRRVGRDGPGRIRLAGFFSPGCTPCAEQLPEFLRYAERFRGPVLAVVAADPAADGDGQAARYVAELEPVAQVVVEPEGGPVCRAFGVSAFPVLCLLGDDGRVRASGYSMAALPDLARV